MQQNVPSGQNNDQQPTLPSYAEATRMAPPPANFLYNHNASETYQVPAATAFGVTSQPIQTPYPVQSNYNQTIFPPTTTVTYPATYPTNAYPQYGPALDESGIPPTTIHIIRPVSSEPATCCSGRSGRILGILLGLVILGAIFRVIMSAYF